MSQPHYGTCHQYHLEGISEESDECDKPVNSVMQKLEFTAGPNRSIDWIYWSSCTAVQLRDITNRICLFNASSRQVSCHS